MGRAGRSSSIAPASLAGRALALSWLLGGPLACGIAGDPAAGAGCSPAEKACGPDLACNRASGECYDPRWADWPMPNAHIDGLPHWQNYDTTALPGVVADLVTGLFWQRDLPGDTFLQPDAEAYCAGLSLGGHTDWRLPSVAELVSIVDVTQTAPAIDPDAFPATPAAYFWTSMPVGASTTNFWAVNFNTGYPNDAGTLGAPAHARCVR